MDFLACSKSKYMPNFSACRDFRHAGTDVTCHFVRHGGFFGTQGRTLLLLLPVRGIEIFLDVWTVRKRLRRYFRRRCRLPAIALAEDDSLTLLICDAFGNSIKKRYAYRDHGIFIWPPFTCSLTSVPACRKTLCAGKYDRYFNFECAKSSTYWDVS